MSNPEPIMSLILTWNQVFNYRQPFGFERTVQNVLTLSVKSYGPHYVGSTSIYIHARTRRTHTQYLKIQQSVQLVLNDGQRLNQLLCVHGTHHTVNPDRTGNKHAHNCSEHLVEETFFMQMLMQMRKKQKKEMKKWWQTIGNVKRGN